GFGSGLLRAGSQGHADQRRRQPLRPTISHGIDLTLSPGFGKTANGLRLAEEDGQTMYRRTERLWPGFISSFRAIPSRAHQDRERSPAISTNRIAIKHALATSQIAAIRQHDGKIPQKAEPQCGARVDEKLVANRSCVEHRSRIHREPA